MAWNLLKVEDPLRKHLVVSGIVGALRSVWRESWGPRLEYILFNAIATLLECENASLLGVSRILTDRDYRRWALKQVKDPAVVHHESRRDLARHLAEDIAYRWCKKDLPHLVLDRRNGLGYNSQVLAFELVLPIFYKPGIFIANLAKGAIGEDKSNLIGALLVAQFGQAAMSRVSVPEESRVDFHLAIDEFQNFTTDSISSILSEARKYRLSLTLAHQYIGQLTPVIRTAVFGNVGSLVSFRVGEEDGAVLERAFGYTYPAEHFTGLSNHETCVRLIRNGQHLEPFTGRTMTPEVKPIGREAQKRREKIIWYSRKRYTTPRAEVETKLERSLKVVEGEDKTRHRRVKKRVMGGVTRG